MVPAITAGGRSFKGAAAYYLHDKREPGETARHTAARVAWTETVNLPTQDPERAWRMMADTALSQADLKAAAGKKATGRKLENPVFAYSLSWHPDEQPTRQDQLDAARATLKELGLEDHQALIVCHNDEPQAHVHVIVNRVDAATGIAAALKKSKLKLSKWAERYETGRGKIYCEKRVENNLKRGQGEQARDKRTPRPVYERDKAISNDDLTAAFIQTGQKQKDAQLYAAGRTLKTSFARQWAELKRVYLDARKKVIAFGRHAKATAQAEQAKADKENARPIDTGIALRSLTEKRSTFTRTDLERYAKQHTRSAAAARATIAAVLDSAATVTLGKDRLNRVRYTVHDLQEIEQGMRADAVTLQECAGHEVTNSAKEKALGYLPFALSEDQLAAFHHITDAKDLAAVVGFAGTGKSAMLGAARAAWEADGYRVRGAALSGIAADGLQDVGIDSRTVHSLLFRLDQGSDELHRRDILVIDEAGMIGSRQMARLATYAKKAGAKLVLVGDPEQLQAIDAGGAFRAITEKAGAATMTTVRRQREAWQQEATRELAAGSVAEALHSYEQAGMLHGHDSQADAMTAIVTAWDKQRQEDPAQTQIILAYRRSDVRALNELARAARQTAGELGEERTITTGQGERQFAANDRIYFLANDRALGVRNGSLGTIQSMTGKRMVVKLDNGRTVEFDPSAYNSIDHGYAATVHKSQGVTVDRAHVLATSIMDKHAAYVGLTRHRNRVDIHWSGDEFENRASLSRALARQRLKDTSLDYPDDPAEQEETAGRDGRQEEPKSDGAARAEKQMRADLARLREEFLRQADTLRASQDRQADAEREAWQERNDERSAAYAPYSRDSATRWEQVAGIGANSLEQQQGITKQRGRGLDSSSTETRAPSAGRPKPPAPG